MTNRGHSTAKDVTYCFEKHVLPEFGTKRLRDISLEQLQMFFNRLARKLKWGLGNQEKSEVVLQRGIHRRCQVWVPQAKSGPPVDLGPRPVHRQPELPSGKDLALIAEQLPEGKIRMFFLTV